MLSFADLLSIRLQSGPLSRINLRHGNQPSFAGPVAKPGNRVEPHQELMLEDDLPRQSAALVFSGGVESAVLADALMRNFKRVHPLYVKFGLHW